jgi:hypothetical protein
VFDLVRLLDVSELLSRISLWWSRSAVALTARVRASRASRYRAKVIDAAEELRYFLGFVSLAVQSKVQSIVAVFV